MGKPDRAAAFGQQIAALPIRRSKNGDLKVLMVTSRESRRWVMPKGWTMEGRKNWEAAKIEALEEAGAIGYVGSSKIGEFRYTKIMDDGRRLPCRVKVYPMIVDRLKPNWKERKERKRKWFSPEGAAKRVDEPDLARLLRLIGRRGMSIPEIQDVLKAS